MAYIEVSNFSKYYGETLAVNNISFSINKAEVVGFIGKNGAGKSTTIRAMLNMIFPSSGSIKINGLDSVLDTKLIKANTGYIPSETAFAADMHIDKFFKFCMKYKGASDNRLTELKNLFEIDSNKLISELSLGNRKKLSIIQMFLSPCDLYIMDEPTIGLDPLMQNKFFSIMQSLNKQGATIFLSSHNLADIEKYCTRVLIIENGKIVDDIKTNTFKHKKHIKYQTKSGLFGTLPLGNDINKSIAELAKLDLASLDIVDSNKENLINYYKEAN